MDNRSRKWPLKILLLTRICFELVLFPVEVMETNLYIHTYILTCFFTFNYQALLPVCNGWRTGGRVWKNSLHSEQQPEITRQWVVTSIRFNIFVCGWWSAPLCMYYQDENGSPLILLLTQLIETESKESISQCSPVSLHVDNSNSY